MLTDRRDRRARRRGCFAWLLTGGLFSLLVFLGGALVGHFVWTSSAGTPPSGASGFALPGTPGPSGVRHTAAPGAPGDARSLARATDPGLVDVETSLSYLGEQAAGTGIIASAGGVVWTNNHVIEGATTIHVRDVASGVTYAARVVGYDRSKDVAVLRLTGASGLHAAPIAARARPQVGEGVVAVGNAEGRGGTPSYAAGSVTATSQSITASDSANGGAEHLSGLIQTNAAVRPGDSGGALVATSRKVIGMVTAASGSFRFPSAPTEGFAIPMPTVARIARTIEAGQPAPGIHLGPTAFLGVVVHAPATGRGARILEAVPRGPAAGAGLRAGDTITALDGHRVASPNALTAALLAERPGARVRVAYRGPGGRAHHTTATLTSGPPQ